jgi:hypothetical protein
MEKTAKAHQRGKEIKKRRVLYMRFQANLQGDWDSVNEKNAQATKVEGDTDVMKID